MPPAPTSQLRRPVARRSVLIGGLATLFTASGATAWALDEYVVDHVEVADAATGDTGTALDTANAVATADTWTADGTTVTVTKVETGSGADTVTYFVADLDLTDATVLRTAFAQDQFGQNIVEDTSVIAERHQAAFAVNGDYYGFRDTGMEIRNGVVYRSEGAREGLAFYKDGRARLYDETATTAEKLLAAGVWNTLSFGPALVRGGAVVDGIDQVEVDTNFGNHSIQGANPRTAVGFIATNHVVFVVVDGRDEGYSRGATLPELAEIMRGLGCLTAYNLDGGGSSTMYFQGEVVNRPSNDGERGVSDILFIGG